MYHGVDRTNGMEVDLGAYFDRNPPFLQSAAFQIASYNLYRSSSSIDDYYNFVGANYSFSIHGFYLKGGVVYPFNDRSRNAFFLPAVQAGYTVLLNY